MKNAHTFELEEYTGQAPDAKAIACDFLEIFSFVFQWRHYIANVLPQVFINDRDQRPTVDEYLKDVIPVDIAMASREFANL